MPPPLLLFYRVPPPPPLLLSHRAPPPPLLLFHRVLPPLPIDHTPSPRAMSQRRRLSSRSNASPPLLPPRASSSSTVCHRFSSSSTARRPFSSTVRRRPLPIDHTPPPRATPRRHHLSSRSSMSAPPLPPRSGISMEGYNASSKEIEEYHMMMSQMFRSEEEGFKHYNSYAKEKGCSVRLDDKDCIGGTETVMRRCFSCFKEGMLFHYGMQIFM